MDLIQLQRRLSSYRTQKGQCRNIPPELLVDILRTWEGWTGTNKEFYTGLGLTMKQFGPLLQAARKAVRDGLVEPNAEQAFTELTSVAPIAERGITHSGIELYWDEQRVIRFFSAQQLVEFLKLVA